MFAKNEFKIFYVLFICCILSSNVSATLFSIANAIAGSSGPRANYEMAPSSPPPKPTLGKMIGDKIDGIRNFKAMVFTPLLNLASVLLTKGDGSASTSSKAPAPPSSGGIEKGKTTETAAPPPYAGGGGAPAYYGGGTAVAPSSAYYGGGATPGYYGGAMGGAPPSTYYGGDHRYFNQEAFPTYNGERGKRGYYNFGGPPPSARYMHGNSNSKSGVFVDNYLSDKYQYDISHPATY